MYCTPPTPPPPHTHTQTTHQAALDEAALDQSLGNIASLELRNMCQRFVRGVREVEAGVQGVMEQISVLKPPNSPDLERVHSAIDQCQVCYHSVCVCSAGIVPFSLTIKTN